VPGDGHSHRAEPEALSGNRADRCDAGSPIRGAQLDVTYGRRVGDHLILSTRPSLPLLASSSAAEDFFTPP